MTIPTNITMVAQWRRCCETAGIGNLALISIATQAEACSGITQHRGSGAEQGADEILGWSKMQGSQMTSLVSQKKCGMKGWTEEKESEEQKGRNGRGQAVESRMVPVVCPAGWQNVAARQFHLAKACSPGCRKCPRRPLAGPRLVERSVGSTPSTCRRPRPLRRRQPEIVRVGRVRRLSHLTFDPADARPTGPPPDL